MDGSPVRTASNRTDEEPKKLPEAAAAIREIDRMEGIETVLRVGVSLIEQLEGQPPTPETMRAYQGWRDGLSPSA